MTTDNRTNEPNKYSGFVARQNHQRDPWRGIGKKCLCGVVFDSDVDHSMHQVEAILEAALVAAAGAAPQAESNPTSSYISPSLPGMIRNLWKSDPSENSVRTALKLAGDLIQELIDLKAAPVLPSSTVDEGKITEVIAQANYDWPRQRLDFWRRPSSVEPPGDLDQFIARAVVEAIGGESRGE